MFDWTQIWTLKNSNVDFPKEPTINDITHLGGGRSAKRWRYSRSLFSKIGDKGEGGVKNLKKSVMPFMDGCKHQKSNFETYQDLPKMPEFRLLFGCTKTGRGITKLLNRIWWAIYKNYIPKPVQVRSIH